MYRTTPISNLEAFLEQIGSERLIDYSLERFRSALQAVQNPERDAKTIVIAGTNGKGTVSLLLSNALREAGFKVGTYLSPHLQQPNERFLDGLRPERESELLRLAKEHWEISKQYRLTYFEFLTLLCFAWASRKKFDFLVLEVGLGGRLDATNVTTPLACAITTIDLDHQEYLGNTVEKILEEKMGILRAGSPVFSGITQSSLRSRLDQRCAELGVTCHYGHV